MTSVSNSIRLRIVIINKYETKCKIFDAGIQDSMEKGSVSSEDEDENDFSQEELSQDQKELDDDDDDDDDDDVSDVKEETILGL